MYAHEPVRRGLHIGGVVGLLLAGGCGREQADEICPPVGVGDLVVSEIRGSQADANSNLDQGQWIELYNASGGEVDLHGLHLRFVRLDGSGEGRVIVRRSLVVAAGDRAVLSFFGDDVRPVHTDYGWFPDFLTSSGTAQSIHGSGVIDVVACDLRIDRVRTDGLPTAGTWALGVEPPDATTNDDPAAWCVDATDDADPTTIGLPGTPGASNPPCP